MNLGTKIIVAILSFVAALLAFWPSDRDRQDPDEHDPRNGGGGV